MAAAIQDQIDRKTHGKVLIGGTAVITAAGLSPVALAAARSCLSKPASCDAILTGVVDAVASEATGGASLVVGAGTAAKTAELIVENVARKTTGKGAKELGKLELPIPEVNPVTVAIDLKNLTWRKLLEEASSFPSRQSASEVATMIGAYDPVSGAYAVGRSSPTITAEMLDPRTVAFVEGRLGVPIGSKTTLCSSIAEACAELMAADELIRKGVDPSRIEFTEAVRPRNVWRKSEITDKSIIETCPNCENTWK